MQTKALPLFLFSLFFSCAQLLAQRFELEADEAEKSVYLKELHLKVEIMGNFALTKTEMVFYNPNNRILEGTLEFPLLEGQSVIGFAMEVNGNLREAVPVEKNKGQAVFESIERRRVDPGLLEKIEGNHYRARIYPLRPQTSKKVVITTLEELDTVGDHSTYQLPMHYGKVDHFSIQLSVNGPDESPALKTEKLNGLVFSGWKNQRESSAQAEDFVAEGILSLDIPSSVQGKAFVETFKGKTYFYAPVALGESGVVTREIPSSINLFWDSSSSAARSDFKKAFAFLDHLFSTVDQVQVRLIRFRNLVEEPINFVVNKGDWRILAKELKETIYDGGTNLSVLAGHFERELNLLFSDGMHNFGPKEKLSAENPVFCLYSVPTANTAQLRSIARASGGEVIDLIRNDSTVALKRLLTPRARVEAVEYNPQEVAFVYPEKGQALDRHFGISGVLRVENAVVKMKIRNEAGALETIVIKVSDHAEKSSLAAYQWATQKLFSLESDFEENETAIKALGSHFGIVTGNTSLIVLETVQDYVQYEIRPPADLLDQYEAIMDNRNRALLKNQDNHLERVVDMFQKRIEWYEKDWPKNRPKISKDEEKRRGSVQRGSEAEESSVELNDLVVHVDDGRTYLANNSSSATSFNVELRDLPVPISVVTKQFLEEQGATDFREALEYSAGVPAAEKDEGTNQTKAPADRGQTTIALKPWEPDSAYAEHLRKETGEALYRAYLEEKPDYANSPSFYLDCFDLFVEKNERRLGLRVLSNLAEIEIENHAILRVLAYRLLQANEVALAIPLFEKIKRIRAEEPQSYRDLALAYQAAGQDQKAVDLLWHVVNSVWDRRFPEVELIALMELNALIARSKAELDLSEIDQRLLKAMSLDIRVVLTWDADNTDMDLWVIDPNGEKCYYSHRLTYQGGLMSSDFTGGYGPEVFLLKDAKKGTYKIKANYYGSQQQILAGPTTLQLRLQKNFGERDQEEKTITLRLTERKEEIEVGEFVIE